MDCWITTLQSSVDYHDVLVAIICGIEVITKSCFFSSYILTSISQALIDLQCNKSLIFITIVIKSRLSHFDPLRWVTCIYCPVFTFSSHRGGLAIFRHLCGILFSDPINLFIFPSLQTLLP